MTARSLLRTLRPRCGELVCRDGVLSLCLDDATRLAVVDWAFPSAHIALCAEHAARSPPCVALLYIGPQGPRLRVV